MAEGQVARLAPQLAPSQGEWCTWEMLVIYWKSFWMWTRACKLHVFPFWWAQNCSQAFSWSQQWVNLIFAMRGGILVLYLKTSELSTETKWKIIRICFKMHLNVAPYSEVEMLCGETEACIKTTWNSDKLCSSFNILSDLCLHSQHQGIAIYH